MLQGGSCHVCGKSAVANHLKDCKGGSQCNCMKDGPKAINNEVDAASQPGRLGKKECGLASACFQEGLKQCRAVRGQDATRIQFGAREGKNNAPVNSQHTTALKASAEHAPNAAPLACRQLGGHRSLPAVFLAPRDGALQLHGGSAGQLCDGARDRARDCVAKICRGFEMIGKRSFATVAKHECAKLKADQPWMVEVTGEGARQNGAADFTAMRSSCQKAGHLRTWKQLLSHHCHLDKPFAAKLIEGAPNATDSQRLGNHKATFTQAHGNPDKQRVAREKVVDLLLTAMHNGELDPRLLGCGETPLMDAQIVIDAASVHRSREEWRGTMKNLQKNVFPAFGKLLGQDCLDMINGAAQTVTKMLNRQRDTQNQVHGDDFDQKKKDCVADPAEGDASGGCGRHRRGGGQRGGADRRTGTQQFAGARDTCGA